MSEKKRIGLICAGVLIAFAVGLKIYMDRSVQQAEPSSSGYYSGPTMNKARTMIVSSDGKTAIPVAEQPSANAQPMTAGKPVKLGE